MDLQKLHARLTKKLPLLRQRYGLPVKQRLFLQLSQIDSDFQWVWGRVPNDKPKLSHAMRSLLRGGICVVCDYNLADRKVCSPCYQIPEGRRIAIQDKWESAGKTMLKRYGADNAMKSHKIRKKAQSSIKAIYGVANVSQSEEIKEKKAATCLSNFGVEHPSQSHEVQKKIRSTSRRKYGTEYPNQSPEVRAKIEATFRRVYGANSPMQSSEYYDKYRKDHYSPKPITVLGEEHHVQGYEPQVIQHLEDRGLIDWIVTENSQMPSLWYRDLNGKRRKYYPDFVFESTSGGIYIVEVKSSFTLRRPNVLEKANAARALCRRSNGLLRFALAVWEPDSGVRWIRSEEEFHGYE